VIAPEPRNVAIPRLLHVDKGCLRTVAALLERHRFDLGRVLIGSGPGPSRMLAETVVTGLRQHGVEALHRSGLTGRLHEAAVTAGVIIEEGVTLALAVGGGRVIDTVKFAAARTGVDFVSVPTTISNDGISSPVASLVGRDGARASHAARMPCGIVVDVSAVGSAPARTVRAGAGDLVSNLTACLDWRGADAVDAERYDAYPAMIAESAARPVLDLEEIGSTAAHQVLAQGLVLSGLAMAAAGTSRPCSGAEHLISHALDARLGADAALHGEQVALGCLISAAAHESPLLPVLRRTFRRLGMPTRPQDLGLSHAQLVAAVVDAPAIRPDRWTILTDAARTPEAASRLVRHALGAAERRSSRLRGASPQPPAIEVTAESRASTRPVAAPSSQWQKRARNLA
jgi:glycerol-1-phosphate dehydrogenase [NAD(P)+]